MSVDIFVHAANALYLASYLVRDIRCLRLLGVAAALLLMPYFLLQASPLWPPVAWNLLFVTINLWRIRTTAGYSRFCTISGPRPHPG